MGLSSGAGTLVTANVPVIASTRLPALLEYDLPPFRIWIATRPWRLSCTHRGRPIFAERARGEQASLEYLTTAGWYALRDVQHVEEIKAKAADKSPVKLKGVRVTVAAGEDANAIVEIRSRASLATLLVTVTIRDGKQTPVAVRDDWVVSRGEQVLTAGRLRRFARRRVASEEARRQPIPTESCALLSSNGYGLAVHAVAPEFLSVDPDAFRMMAYSATIHWRLALGPPALAARRLSEGSPKTKTPPGRVRSRGIWAFSPSVDSTTCDNLAQQVEKKGWTLAGCLKLDAQSGIANSVRPDDPQHRLYRISRWEDLGALRACVASRALAKTGAGAARHRFHTLAWHGKLSGECIETTIAAACLLPDLAVSSTELVRIAETPALSRWLDVHAALLQLEKRYREVTNLNGDAVPFVRPMCFAMTTKQAWESRRQWMLGNDVLVAVLPPARRGRAQEVLFPAGDWEALPSISVVEGSYEGPKSVKLSARKPGVAVFERRGGKLRLSSMLRTR